jgi:hypothetical protein
MGCDRLIHPPAPNADLVVLGTEGDLRECGW